MEAFKQDFYNALVGVVIQDSLKMSLQIAYELNEAGEPTTLDRELSGQLFGMEWLYARLPWLCWKARQFSDKQIGKDLAALLNDLEQQMRDLLKPYHNNVPFGMDHYSLTIESYERGQPFGPAGSSAGPGIGILECYKHALKDYDPDAPEIGPAESFAILAAGDHICWTLDTDDWESAVKRGLEASKGSSADMGSQMENKL